MLNKVDIRKLERVKKLLACQLADCGNFIELSVDEHTMKLDESKIEYAGMCNRCGKRFKLKQKYVSVLSRGLGSPKIVIVPTTFAKLFGKDD